MIIPWRTFPPLPTWSACAHQGTPCPCRFNAENLPSPLFLTDKASESYFWKSLAKPVRHSLVNKPYAMENHKNGAPWNPRGRRG